MESLKNDTNELIYKTKSKLTDFEKNLMVTKGEKYVLVTQLCLTLCNPMDCSMPGAPLHGILQTRILEWVAIPFSRDLPNPGIKPRSPALQADSLPSELSGKPKGER